MATTPSKARLFVALDLPGPARARLLKWRERAFADHEDLRLVAPEALHVTLAFLGYLPEAEIGAVAHLMKAALPRVDAPLLTATGLRPVPPRRPRLFALDLDDQAGRAGLVQAAVSAALATGGLYEPETRPFWPHVTLARVKKGQVVRGLGEPPPPPTEPWQAEAVTLYRSHLRRGGASYEALERLGFS